MLVELVDFRYRNVYQELGFPGCSATPLLAPGALERLVIARDSLLAEGFELVVLDAYRTRAAQQHLYDITLAQIQCDHDCSEEEARERIVGFVAKPAGIFPHGTGGAVDVTLAQGAEELWLGTDFDEVSPVSARDYFREFPPTDEREQAAHLLREQLRGAMEAAGFIGLKSEWWHFEYGTPRWAAETQSATLYGQVVDSVF
jgi:zinc D-Ala-D-Ala dipeptidase